MSTTTHTVTADQLFMMPEDGFRYELVKGELRKMSPAGSEHGAIIVNITFLLVQHIKAHKLGVAFGAETGFKIASNPDTVRAPDFAFVGHDKIPESGITKKFWPGAPDLAVEVVSPGDTFDEVSEKVADWLAAGTGAVWIVNPKLRNVTIYRALTDVSTFSENDVIEGQDVVPGFRCEVSEIFV